MTNKTTAFRANVRHYLGLLKMTQEKLAEEASLSPEWLCRMLAGKSNPTLPVCERIARALRVSLEALVSEPTDATEAPTVPILPSVSENPQISA